MIDTHVHVVAGDRDRYPLRRHDHPGHEWVDVAPDADSLAASMAAAGVGGAVLVQPLGAYGDDNSYTCDAAADDEWLAAVAIVDMRMPGGWDGLETMRHLLAEDERLQIIICTAYSDRFKAIASGRCLVLAPCTWIKQLTYCNSVTQQERSYFRQLKL